MHRKKFVEKTIHLSVLTLLSRIFGLARELVKARYLGANVVADMFAAAFRLPAAVHKIFTEGAVSAAFVPAAIKISKQDGRHQVDKLLTLTMIVTQAVLSCLCFGVFFFADRLMMFIVPGWVDTPQLIAQAAHLLRILMFYIFFFSASSFLSGALQATNHFLLGAIQPIILNILLIAQIGFCWYSQASIATLAWFFVMNGIIILLLTMVVYLRHASFSWPPNEATWRYFRYLCSKLVPCFISLGIVEINTFIDTQFASFLKVGSIALLGYGSTIMRAPLGIFATTFATISLPHLARISGYAPRRLSFHLLESAKAVLWITLPVMLIMSFFSYSIFATLFLSERFSVLQAQEGGYILVAYLVGLFFLSMNRIVLNIYYALHETLLPTIISVVGALANMMLNFILMRSLHAIGLALATSIAGILQLVLFLWFLKSKFNLPLYIERFSLFGYRYIKQLIFILPLFYFVYTVLEMILYQLPTPLASFFTKEIGLWLWVGPLSLLLLGALWITRKRFGIKIYYFD